MAEWATLERQNQLGNPLRLSKDFFLCLLTGLLVARADLYGLYPFGAIYVLGLLFMDRSKMAAGLLGVTAGLLSLQDADLLLRSGGLLLLGVPWVWKMASRKTAFFIGSTSVLAILIFWGTAWLRTAWNQQVFLSGAVQGILAAGFLTIFLYVEKNRIKAPKTFFSGEQGAAALLLLGLLLLGLKGVVWGPVNLQITGISFLVLYIADRLGLGAGAGAGAVLGFLLGWDGGVNHLTETGMFCLLGFCCGAFRKLGKWGMLLAFGAFVLMTTFYISGEAAITAHLYSYGSGLLLFLLLPSAPREKMFPQTKIMPEIESSAAKVRAVAGIFEAMALESQQTEAGGNFWRKKSGVEEMISALTKRVCGECTKREICWGTDFCQSHRHLLELLNALEQGAEEKDLLWKKNTSCLHRNEMRMAADFVLEREGERGLWRKREEQRQKDLAVQYKSIALLINHLAAELYSRHNYEKGRPLFWQRKQNHLLEIGVGNFIKTGNAISGDNYQAIPLSPAETALVLCDGMGVGEQAAQMSATALTMLERLLQTGFEPERAVQTLNSILTLQMSGEKFVTLDMAVFHLEAGRVRLIKMGAAPAYLLDAAGRVTVQTGTGLPAGILAEIEIPVIDIPFREETLIMVTDGILDVARAKEKTDWLEAFLKKEKTEENPQRLAEKIIAQAEDESKGVLNDDGLVLVIKKK